MSSPQSRQANYMSARSVIAAWLRICGSLQTDGEIVAEGEITGDVRCVRLVVGLDACITGDIVAEEVIVHGKIKGCIRANRVVLEEAAVVEGEIFHRSLTVQRGACFEGASRRRDQPLAADLDRNIENLKRASRILRHLDHGSAQPAKQVA